MGLTLVRRLFAMRKPRVGLRASGALTTVCSVVSRTGQMSARSKAAFIKAFDSRCTEAFALCVAFHKWCTSCSWVGVVDMPATAGVSPALHASHKKAGSSDLASWPMERPRGGPSAFLTFSSSCWVCSTRPPRRTGAFHSKQVGGPKPETTLHFKPTQTSSWPSWPFSCQLQHRGLPARQQHQPALPQRAQLGRRQSPLRLRLPGRSQRPSSSF